ncbi:hypothetical protein LTR62_005872 [Meristemomyces frigidus]|uniref:Uncharacterized protein n=1 Tax=Meristemomyces frigidus TaxID=1508187 RepID=A0AAN7TIN6_9PEZI|nr:hypothetical protein LTR62_005872 [Meristemomyces frigidus]
MSQLSTFPGSDASAFALAAYHTTTNNHGAHEMQPQRGIMVPQAEDTPDADPIGNRDDALTAMAWFAAAAEAGEGFQLQQTSTAGNAFTQLQPPVSSASAGSSRDGDDGVGEATGDDLAGVNFFFESVDHAKAQEFHRAPLRINPTREDDAAEYEADERKQKQLVAKMIRAFSSDWSDKIEGGERFTAEQRTAEWRRYQQIHQAKVNQILEREEGAREAELRAWFLLDALFEAHRHGIWTFTHATDTTLIFSERAGFPIDAKKLKITNLWVNFGKKLVNDANPTKKSSKKSRKASAGEVVARTKESVVATEQEDEVANTAEDGVGNGQDDMDGLGHPACKRCKRSAE